MKEYPEIVDMIYLNTSELLRRKEEVDLLSVDQLLKQGK